MDELTADVFLQNSPVPGSVHPGHPGTLQPARPCQRQPDPLAKPVCNTAVISNPVLGYFAKVMYSLCSYLPSACSQRGQSSPVSDTEWLRSPVGVCCAESPSKLGFTDGLWSMVPFPSYSLALLNIGMQSHFRQACSASTHLLSLFSLSQVLGMIRLGLL